MWSVFNTLSSLKTFLCGFGVWTPLVFLILQIVQVVVAPIPGGPLTMLGGMLFGWWQGFLLSALGEIFGSCMGFLITRRVGEAFVKRFDKKDWSKKLLNLNEDKLGTILFIVFILPGFPDDIACLAAGLTPMPFPKFLKLCLLGRLPGFLLNSLIGAGIMLDNHLLTLVILAAYLSIVLLAYLLFHGRAKRLIVRHQQKPNK